MKLNNDKPLKISTSRFKRNLIILILFILAVFGAGAWWYVHSHPNMGNQIQSMIDDSPNVPDTQNEDDDIEADNNTPQKAAEFLVSYYSALSSNDSGSLRDISATEAANAIDMGWLGNIGYSVDINKLGDVQVKDNFPSSVGTYIGCDLYNVSDFYTECADDALTSDVTGKTKCFGWIWYDNTNDRWEISDPTIPTAISAPESPNVERYSSDKSVLSRISSNGAYANPWWCYAKLNVDISNSSHDEDVKISKTSFDSGVTCDVPDTILAGVNRTSSDRNEVNGDCEIVRGVTSGFSSDKIGSDALSLEGNVCPVKMEYGDENISPVFALGDTTSADIISKESSSDIKKYNATSNVASES